MDIKFSAQILVIGMLLATIARAQLPDLHSRFRQSEPGAWASYRLSGARALGVSELHLAAVGEEIFEGTRHLWYEWTSVAGPDTCSGRSRH